MEKQHKTANFLLIGAMKAGTTSIWRHLQSNSQIYLPPVKEPHFLCHNEPASTTLTRYDRLFAAAHDDQLCGDASTGYSKYPRIKRIPARAHELFGPDVKIIYCTRNPIDRLVSHFHHDLRAGRLPPSLESAIRQNDDLVAFSDYALQVERWLEYFPLSQIHVFSLEAYLRSPSEHLDKLAAFLGIAANFSCSDNPVQANQASESHVGRGFLLQLLPRIKRTEFFKTRVYPYIPLSLRHLVRPLFYRKGQAPVQPDMRLSVELANEILKRLSESQKRLAKYLESEASGWNLQTSIARITGSAWQDCLDNHNKNTVAC